jgi:hypothetical protein
MRSPALRFARNFLITGLLAAATGTVAHRTDPPPSKASVKRQRTIAALRPAPPSSEAAAEIPAAQTEPVQREALAAGLGTKVTSGGGLPAEGDRANVAPATWVLADLIVEDSKVTGEGYVEYTLRGTLRGDGSRLSGAEVVAAARPASPEVSIVSNATLHFTARAADDLDSLSRDSIRVLIRGGLTFEPSMLRWTFASTPVAAILDREAETTDAGDSNLFDELQAANFAKIQ